MDKVLGILEIHKDAGIFLRFSFFEQRFPHSAHSVGIQKTRRHINKWQTSHIHQHDPAFQDHLQKTGKPKQPLLRIRIIPGSLFAGADPDLAIAVFSE